VPLPLKCQANTTEPDSQLFFPSIPISATTTRYVPQTTTAQIAPKPFTLRHAPGRNNGKFTALIHDNGTSDQLTSIPTIPNLTNDVLPMMSSSCPGFVCYVEKTAPYAIPYLSTAKSQMAVAGYIVKHLINSNEQDINNYSSHWYHVAVMPCHDKKLEASRRDLAWDSIMNRYQPKRDDQATLVHDVDLVITTSELLDLVLEIASENTECLNETAIKNHGRLRSYFDQIIPAAPLSTLHNTCEIDSERQSEKSSLNRPFGLQPFEVHSQYSVSNSNPFTHGHSSKVLILVQSSQFYQDMATNDDHEFSMDNWSAPFQTAYSGSSGAYADFTFRYAAKELFGVILPLEVPLPWITSALSVKKESVNNSSNFTKRLPRPRANTVFGDFMELKLLKLRDGSYTCHAVGSDSLQSTKPVLNFCLAYGFKNIQGIMQSIKPRSSNSSSDGYCFYHYLEVMACPSGCLNGGGQVHSLNDTKLHHTNGSDTIPSPGSRKETPTARRERMTKCHMIIDSRPVRPMTRRLFLNDVYHALGMHQGSRKLTSTNGDLSSAVIETEIDHIIFNQNAQEAFHTRYHFVPKLELASGAVSGVQISNTKW